MKSVMNKYWYYIITLSMLPELALAQHSSHSSKGSFGGIARNVQRPVEAVIDIVRGVCLIAGVGMVVGSIIKYKQHRNNPVEVTMGSVITLLLVGLALIAITFIPIGKT